MKLNFLISDLTKDSNDKFVGKTDFEFDKMIPNPQVGVPYYLAFMMFNKKMRTTASLIKTWKDRV